MSYTNFKARIKKKNRELLNRLKPRYHVKSAAAVLNRLLDQEREAEQQPTIITVECQCGLRVPAVNVNRYAICGSCRSVFTHDGLVRWHIPPRK